MDNWHRIYSYVHSETPASADWRGPVRLSVCGVPTSDRALCFFRLCWKLTLVVLEEKHSLVRGLSQVHHWQAFVQERAGSLRWNWAAIDVRGGEENEGGLVCPRSPSHV